MKLILGIFLWEEVEQLDLLHGELAGSLLESLHNSGKTHIYIGTFLYRLSAGKSHRHDDPQPAIFAGSPRNSFFWIILIALCFNNWMQEIFLLYRWPICFVSGTDQQASSVSPSWVVHQASLGSSAVWNAWPKFSFFRSKIFNEGAV